MHLAGKSRLTRKIKKKGSCRAIAGINETPSFWLALAGKTPECWASATYRTRQKLTRELTPANLDTTGSDRNGLK